jgi:hypothetical protein
MLPRKMWLLMVLGVLMFIPAQSMACRCGRRVRVVGVVPVTPVVVVRPVRPCCFRPFGISWGFQSTSFVGGFGGGAMSSFGMTGGIGFGGMGMGGMGMGGMGMGPGMGGMNPGMGGMNPGMGGMNHGPVGPLPLTSPYPNGGVVPYYGAQNGMGQPGMGMGGQPGMGMQPGMMRLNRGAYNYRLREKYRAANYAFKYRERGWVPPIY